jgi:hypothetical protein
VTSLSDTEIYEAHSKLTSPQAGDLCLLSTRQLAHSLSVAIAFEREFENDRRCRDRELYAKNEVL